jgi:hypothetical protein
MDMLAAIPFDTLVFIVLALIAGFFRWVSKQAENAKRNAQDGTQSKPISPQPAEGTDEERVRRFLEALGQPTARPTPRIEKRSVKPVEKRVVVPQGRPIFSPLPPLTTVPPPLPVEPQIPQPPPPVIQPKVIAPPVPAAPRREILSTTSFPETSQRPIVPPSVTALLSSERGLRDAIILREIFGPPRSLQTLEF